jgi:hypothetical protein
MSKKTQLWLGVLVGGAAAYYLYMNYKKTGKFLNAAGKAKYTPQGWYGTATDGSRVYCPSNVRPCPVDLKRIDK